MMKYKYLKKTFNQLKPGDTIYYLRNNQLVKIYVEKILGFVTGKIKIYGRDISKGDDFTMILNKEDKDGTIYNHVIFSNVFELIKNREKYIEDLKSLNKKNLYEKKYNMFNLIINEVELMRKTIKYALS